MHSSFLAILRNVLSSSFAGLWAARVCADHFEKVVIIEPEIWIGPNQDLDPEDFVAVKTREQEDTQSIVNQRTRVRQYHALHCKVQLETYVLIRSDGTFKSIPRATCVGLSKALSQLRL